ncbi:MULTISPECIES: Asp23/Gls24 family envelope stress response protein [unclassified Amycolatopsis]|uniref:Asp23/Gls24 family envelope stress response protein n=1 Tax=unclassified Amycolatopsis TaxID=2618356 RepID=UPI001FF18F9D|nr:Asp23/Gls24 family envelope stress response protein [Amycolatopsis sp. FBCC-B4732]UOX90570.1 Asp23/Gls24 family envelope stress response protein [Amycolatopsis sp. FBCC-B4732]
MTTTLTAPSAERGALTIADQVVERLAVHAVREVEDVGGAAGRVLGLSVGGEDLDRSAKVSVRVDGEAVTLDVRLSIVYPASVARTTGRVREHLRQRVAELTGLTVTRVDITVTALHTTAATPRRVA